MAESEAAVGPVGPVEAARVAVRGPVSPAVRGLAGPARTAIRGPAGKKMKSGPYETRTHDFSVISTTL